MKIAALFVSAAAAIALGGVAHAAPLYDWTGVYVGAVGGYTWSHSKPAYDNPTLQALYPPAALNAKGASGGIEGGYNFQFPNGFVLGVEADASIANLTDTVPDDLGSAMHGAGQTVTAKTDWTASLRGRAGFAMANLLFYGTAGVASSHVVVTATDGNISDSAVLSGWAFGGGIEKSLLQHLSVKLEYIHSMTAGHTWFPGKAYSNTGSSTADSVRLGINLHY